ncbi:MAG: AEC family transporter [Armatimonadota bacterium]|nr:AEC family transporter [Armatimonadota bacterium]
MQTSQTVATTASIFLLLLAGYATKRLGILKASDARVVNALVVNLTMPAFIFVSIHRKPITPEMVHAPVAGFVMEMVVMGLAYAAARLLRLDRRTTGALMLVSAFGNTGFLGYPVVTAAFNRNKSALLSAVMFDEFAMALALNSIGVVVAVSFSGAQTNWNCVFEFLKSPLFPATVVSLLLRNTELPGFLTAALQYLAAGTVPLAMISIGLSLSAGAVKDHPAAIAAALVLKMAVLPILVWLALTVLGITGIVKQVAVLESAMPPAVFSGVVAGRFGVNGTFAAAAIFVLTLCSIVLIPVTLLLIV